MTVICLCVPAIALTCCTGYKSDNKNFIQDNIDNAAAQYTLQIKAIEKKGGLLNPKTTDSLGNVRYIPPEDWCSGFFPGSMWLLNELTGNQKWLELARIYTEALDTVQYLTWHHDVGFIIGCSYLNGYRLNDEYDYGSVIIQAAKSLITRYRPRAGVIQSWDTNKGWQATKGWKCPVIIDNMMNLELLFEATRISGDSTFHKIAVNHANKTMANHFRANHSCYHVVDYDPKTGKVLHKQTAQGYSDESSWARGQAWAIYGFTMSYRYTHDERYLKIAEGVCNYIFTNKNMPADLVPYWDYDAPDIPDEPRDVSAAACTASALYELSTYVPGRNYKQLADSIMHSLASPAYRAKTGTNGNFILMHGVGSKPHNSEVDVPLNYADYYFLEALMRKKNMEQNNKDKIRQSIDGTAK
jgi:hypothetical protein